MAQALINIRILHLNLFSDDNVFKQLVLKYKLQALLKSTQIDLGMSWYGLAHLLLRFINKWYRKVSKLYNPNRKPGQNRYYWKKLDKPLPKTGNRLLLCHSLNTNGDFGIAGCPFFAMNLLELFTINVKRWVGYLLVGHWNSKLFKIQDNSAWRCSFIFI